MKSSIKTYLLLIISLIVIYNNSSSSKSTESSTYYMDEELEQSSEKLFKESKELLDEKNYWDCSRNLILILDSYPKYSRTDEVVYQLGECLYEMDLLNGAKKVYSFLVGKYIDSPFLGFALTGLQRVVFDEQNYEKSLEIYKAIINGKPSEAVIDYSSYYAGLAYYQLGKFQESIIVSSAINETSPYFDHGLYLHGLALLKMKKIKKAIQKFNDICKLPVYNLERTNLINETHLTLGYLYYELGHYYHALKQFNSISREYENYQKVLLSSGWTATKLGQYKEAILYLTEFITNYEENESTPEGWFLLGRCYLKLGLFEKALQSYEYLIEILPETQGYPNVSDNINSFLEIQLNEIQKIKLAILVLESKFMNGISLNMNDQVPMFIKQEKNNILSQRAELITKIRNEHTLLNDLSGKIKKIQNLSNIKDQQKSWRAFAEYGKSRALFLYKKQQLQ